MTDRLDGRLRKDVPSELARRCGSTATAAVICTFAPEGNQWIDV
jgi:hypothetical protein